MLCLAALGVTFASDDDQQIETHKVAFSYETEMSTKPTSNMSAETFARIHVLSAKIFVKIDVEKFRKAKRHPLRNVVYIFNFFLQLLLSKSSAKSGIQTGRHAQTKAPSIELL